MSAENPKSKQAKQWFDRRDFVGLAGLCLLAYGLWLIFPPLALIVPGAILTAVAIFGVKG